MMTLPDLQIKVEIQLTNGKLPERMTEGAAGFDCFAAQTVSLFPGTRKLIPLGFRLALPPGHEAQLRPRSGLAYKHGITIPNAPGTIDCDYRGDISVLLRNDGSDIFNVMAGMRVCQMVIQRVPDIRLVPVPELADTARGEGGWGSTGVNVL